VAPVLAAAGLDVRAVQTRERGHAGRLAAGVPLARCDMLVLVGGDGTVFDALQARRACRDPGRPAYGDPSPGRIQQYKGPGFGHAGRAVCCKLPGWGLCPGPRQRRCLACQRAVEAFRSRQWRLFGIDWTRGRWTASADSSPQASGFRVQPGACMRMQDTARLSLVLPQLGGADTAPWPAQGLLQRPDWAEAARLPLCQVPGGSGNALAANCGLWSPATAAHAICKVRAPAPRSAPGTCALLLPGSTRHIRGGCRLHLVQMRVSTCLAWARALAAWPVRSARLTALGPGTCWEACASAARECAGAAPRAGHRKRHAAAGPALLRVPVHRVWHGRQPGPRHGAPAARPYYKIGLGYPTLAPQEAAARVGEVMEMKWSCVPAACAHASCARGAARSHSRM